jgi:hypothetical protein
MVGQLESNRDAISPDVRGPSRNSFKIARRVWSASARNAALEA